MRLARKNDVLCCPTTTSRATSPRRGWRAPARHQLLLLAAGSATYLYNGEELGPARAYSTCPTS
ncbi:hypothetical protein [Nonomuraea dietziae]|uniref:hypothetical protein n=1 Tax=Nonomuraea dietziae TaxID=65515 RepID=UPI0031D085F0